MVTPTKKRGNFGALLNATSASREEQLSHITKPSATPALEPPVDEKELSQDAPKVQLPDEVETQTPSTIAEPHTAEVVSSEAPAAAEEIAVKPEVVRKAKERKKEVQPSEEQIEGQTVIVTEETNQVLSIIQKKNRKRFSSKTELLEIVIKRGLIAEFPEAKAVYEFVKELKK